MPGSVCGGDPLRIIALHGTSTFPGAEGLPDQLFKLTGLQYFQFGSSNLVGTIPDTIGNLKALSLFWLGGNQMTGSLPESMASLRNLTSLWLQGGNSFSGVMPIFNFTQFKCCELFGLPFSCPLPNGSALCGGGNCGLGGVSSPPSCVTPKPTPSPTASPTPGCVGFSNCSAFSVGGACGCKDGCYTFPCCSCCVKQGCKCCPSTSAFT